MNRLHRVRRITSLATSHGRDTLEAEDRADAVARGDAVHTTQAIGRLTTERFETAHGGWSRHLWHRLEGDAVIAETMIEDGAARCTALGLDFDAEAARLAQNHRAPQPLGELHAGTGQCAPPAHAILPPGWPEAARAAADALHRAWNHRDPAASPAWLPDFLTRFEPGVLLFEDTVVAGHRIAILWRFHAQHARPAYGIEPCGARIRLIGSTVFDGPDVEQETLIDPLAAAVQLLSLTGSHPPPRA